VALRIFIIGDFMTFKVTLFDSLQSKRGQLVHVNSPEELCDILHKKIVSPFIFLNNVRGKKNFIETNVLMLDIDEGVTLSQVKEKLLGLKHIITFTKNHQKEKNGLTTDRMRIALFLNEVIRNERTYNATWKKAYNFLPAIDPQCCDLARVYLPSVKDPKDQPVIQDGALFEVVDEMDQGNGSNETQMHFKNFEEILQHVTAKDKEVKNFSELCHTGLHGKFNGLLNKSAFMCAMNGAKKEDFIAYFDPKCEKPFDATDLAVIESAFTAGEQIKKLPRDNISFYVRNFIAINNVQLKINGSLLLNDQEVKKDSLLNLIYEEALKAGVKKNSKSTILSIFSNWEDEEFKLEIKRFQQKLAFDPNSTKKELERFCVALTGTNEKKNLAVLEHFIWQVKRKLFGRTVTRHMMPVLYGKTASGKTQAVQRLVSPISELTLETDLEALSDTRCDHNFERRFVMIIDELAHVNRAEFSAIKRKMTSDYVEHRVLGTHTNNRIPNKATWIGTSNIPLNDVIKDYTSIRRFYQIETLDKCDWDAINNIDYLGLWKSVDESVSISPVEDMISEISTEQEKFRHHDFVESWATETGILPILQNEWKYVSSTALVQSFKDWRDHYNVQGAFTANSLGRRLTNILGQESVPVEGVRTYKVSKNFNPFPWGGSTESTHY
jgi:hypothetical protein